LYFGFALRGNAVKKQTKLNKKLLII